MNRNVPSSVGPSTVAPPAADGAVEAAGTPDPGTVADLYARSYLIIRTAVGLLGFALPTVLVIGEEWLSHTVGFRGSLSAYYHTAIRDVFVGTLWAIGFLLVVYRAWKPVSWDFLWSSVAGVGAMCVAFFPTSRPGLKPTDARCGTDPQPVNCAPLQQALSEETCQTIHAVSTVAFIGGAAVLALLFAVREWCRTTRRRQSVAVALMACFLVMVTAVVWIFAGVDVTISRWTFERLYVGELVALYAFGISWLTESRLLWKVLRGTAGSALVSAAVAEG